MLAVLKALIMIGKNVSCVTGPHYDLKTLGIIMDLIIV